MLRPFIVLTTVFVLWTASGKGDDRTRELVRMIPAEANAVAIVRVAEIFKTDRAQRENWVEQQAAAFLAGSAVVHPAIEQLVIGSLVHPAVPEEVWSVGLVAVPQATPFSVIAQLEGGPIQDLGGRPSVRSARDALFVDLQPGLIGVRAPAFRQETARWVRGLATPGASTISPILEQAAAQPGHIVLAMDLRDMLDPERALARLTDDSLATQPTTRIHLGTQLLRIQGGLLAITLGDTFEGEVVFEFADALDDSAKVFHQVFLDVLHDMGAGIDEFATAKVSIDGNRLRLKTTFTEEGLRRIVSLIVAPLPSRASAETAASTPPATTPSSAASAAPEKAPQANPSKAYLAAVSKAIDDLKAANRRATEYERTATWHENFARRIDNQPVAGVDPDLLEYGQSVASKMRALAASLRGQKIEINTQAKTYTYNVHFDPGWTAFSVWGGAGYRAPQAGFDSNLREVRERQAAAVAAGADQRQQIWLSIDNDRSAIEQKMRQRYGDDFVRSR